MLKRFAAPWPFCVALSPSVHWHQRFLYCCAKLLYSLGADWPPGQWLRIFLISRKYRKHEGLVRAFSKAQAPDWSWAWSPKISLESCYGENQVNTRKIQVSSLALNGRWGCGWALKWQCGIECATSSMEWAASCMDWSARIIERVTSRLSTRSSRCIDWSTQIFFSLSTILAQFSLSSSLISEKWELRTWNWDLSRCPLLRQVVNLNLLLCSGFNSEHVPLTYFYWRPMNLFNEGFRCAVEPSYCSFGFYLSQGFRNDFPKPWDK